jgi:hypothetical protein
MVVNDLLWRLWRENGRFVAGWIRGPKTQHLWVVHHDPEGLNRIVVVGSPEQTVGKSVFLGPNTQDLSCAEPIANGSHACAGGNTWPVTNGPPFRMILQGLGNSHTWPTLFGFG